MYIQNKIYNYNQIYDSLRTLKLNDYITDKRNNVHNDIYSNAINKMIAEVQMGIELFKTNCIKTYGIEYYETNIDAVAFFYNLIKHHNITFSSTYIVSIIVKLLSCINNMDKGEVDNLLSFNKENYQFIEIKHKNWLHFSKVKIVYIHNLICTSKENNTYSRLIIGPYSLQKFWDTEYISTNNIITKNLNNYVIENIDYIKGTCKIFDKLNMRHLEIDLNNIEDIHNFEFDLNMYDELFHVKRKINII